jgi:signal peptidase I
MGSIPITRSIILGLKKMHIAFDFPLILTVIVLVSGFIYLLDVLFFAKKRKANGIVKPPLIIEYSRSFFPALLIVLAIRSFVIQPYRVPTGSLEPTILPGDFIIVNQFAYGLKLPVLNTRIKKIGEPKLGDIVLFWFPKNTSIVLVKRVIGLPGDDIVYKDKVLTINGKKATQEKLGTALDLEGDVSVPAELRKEILPNGVAHEIFVKEGVNEDVNFEIKVPPNHYFMMGDNRDGSDDSRDWGFVPEENLIGQAFGIWMSWDSQVNTIRWSRIGMPVK